MEEKQIREELYGLMENRLRRNNKRPGDIDESKSLLEQGIYDSMAFIELIADVEEAFAIEIDFENLDAADFTSINQMTYLIQKSRDSQ